MLRIYKGYRGLRKKGFDYTKPGFYFITIDCHRMDCRFGTIKKQKMINSEFGKIVQDEWLKLPTRYPHVRLHMFQIMPNHFHAIIEILDGSIGNYVVAGLAPANPKTQIKELNSEIQNPEFVVAGLAPANPITQQKVQTEALSDIIGGYKSLVSNECLRLHKERYKDSPVIPFLGKIWQRSFYDRIISDKPSYKSISRYIKNNPRKWNRQ